MNTQTKEALKMAIEAMERAEEVDWELNSLHVLNILQAIQACKEALEQPAWQGLREEEMMKLANKYIDLLPNGELFHFDLFAHAIEQELKTKNGFSELKEKNT